jgi:glyoxylase-like metal-dependent hydrolase (beta-lactamase superfamily II)
MTEYIIHPLVVGANETDQGIMTYQRDYGKRIWIPIYVFYLEGGDQTILVDTGLEQFMVPPEVEEMFGFRVMEFAEALKLVNVSPEDVDIIVHTHLHNDHCENDFKCPNARVYVQRVEHEFFENPHPIDHRYYPDLLDDVKEVVLVDGDQEIVDGIDVLLTPGHTPGSQSVVVNTAAGKALITGFCSNERNFPKSGKPIPPGVHTDAIQAYDSCERVMGAADIIIPLHDSSLGKRGRIPD